MRETQIAEFGRRESRQIAETAQAAAIAQARAQVEARYVMALQRPRDMEGVRNRLLADCSRPDFARASRWKLKIGDEERHGWSIRFAEAARRVLGNMLSEEATVYEDEDKRIVRVSATDLETNTSESKELTVPKTVERRFANQREVLGERKNASGDRVFILRATDDEFYAKVNSVAQKTKRQAIVSLIPPELLEECLERVEETLAAASVAVSSDPVEAQQKLASAFEGLRIPRAELERYLGHRMEFVTPMEVEELRRLYAALKEGEAKWEDVMAARGSKPKKEA